ISRDLKICCLRLYDLNILSLDNILNCVRFSWATFFRICKLWEETGNVICPTTACRARPRKLHTDDLYYL
ncbi:uncharacterized protein FOMMEDRAFT_34508, partial [Fomitiporia mediterranea MF3/22]|uniref:uncharacterized protein n=1 Tax=Fomitiporia mediterranea (strain MF3/22) TaxID=694068 RepID=UPI0004407E61